jgi:isopenicillin-N epimerase
MPADTVESRPKLPTSVDGADLGRWLLDPAITFLNHGSFGARTREVAEVQSRWRLEVDARPIEMLDRRLPDLVNQAMAAVGGMLGMSPSNFGFVTNATGGVNAVMRSLQLRPGDEVLTTDHVYNAVRNTMRHLIERAGGRYVQVSTPFPQTASEQVVDSIERAISPRTKLVLVDHVTSPTAVIFPVRRIVDLCRARGIEVMIDGAHAPGMLDLDVESIGATYYTGNLHKWVCAPIGAAFLWVDPARQRDIHPTTISHHLDQGLAAEFGWQGTRDVTPWLTVPAAIEWMGRLGWERVRAHNHALAMWAHSLLTAKFGIEPATPADGSLLGSMAAMILPESLRKQFESAQAMRDHLYFDHRIEVPVFEWNGRWLLRISCQVYNRVQDYERLASVVRRLMDGC